MHWIWRSTIAVSSGLIAYDVTHRGILNRSVDEAFWWLLRMLYDEGTPVPFDSLVARFLLTLLYGSLPLVVTVGVYGVLPLPRRSHSSVISKGVWMWPVPIRIVMSTGVGLLYGAAVGAMFIKSGLRFGWELLVAIAVGGVVAVGAFILTSRRRPPEVTPSCRCGYDLTGNVSGVCPECGEPLAKG